MDRRNFSKLSLLMGAGALTGVNARCTGAGEKISHGFHKEPALWTLNDIGQRDLNLTGLKDALIQSGVYFES